MPRFTVAIAGGGICGLVLALALDKYAPDVDYHIYEAAAKLSTVGAGITVQPRSLFVLQDLGLGPALRKISGNGETESMNMVYRKSDQRDGFIFNRADPAERQWTFHRGELQALFLEHIRHPERIHLGKRFVSYTQPQDSNSEIEIRFEDGSTASCDLFVGADGVKSAVRATMYKQLADAAMAAGRNAEAESLRSFGPAIYSGVSAYRGLVKLDPSTSEGDARPTSVVAHVVMYPISRGRVLNIVAAFTRPELYGTIYTEPWTTSVSADEVTKAFDGWEFNVQDTVKKATGWSKWAINVVKDLPTFVDGRVALVGDAAHSMLPHQGAGAGQGFEDVLLLGRLLGESLVTKRNIPAAFKTYDRFRRPTSQEVASFSMQSGKMHSFFDPDFAVALREAGDVNQLSPEHEYFPKLANKIERLKDWQRGVTIEKDCLAAVGQVREALSGTVSK
ncbi:FAD/NAD-P-binding domain-containing protein [Lenzites betulinus]|nr:FAD/NAD-P-binding domain-containing protein [Lenzites betulinus]